MLSQPMPHSQTIFTYVYIFINGSICLVALLLNALGLTIACARPHNCSQGWMFTINMNLLEKNKHTRFSHRLQGVKAHSLLTVLLRIQASSNRSNERFLREVTKHKPNLSFSCGQAAFYVDT
eukprot:TRINITY_DN2001_c0_g3_i1.p1 TRINITY_DN2001_c0_g3~~TRINITY_DN2001_c0_g3_i1.p1  ORF type:complete len:122 (+),score=2.87 TRINITY_DN2001_c0_g3_i1:372-737(+)